MKKEKNYIYQDFGRLTGFTLSAIWSVIAIYMVVGLMLIPILLLIHSASGLINLDQSWWAIFEKAEPFFSPLDLLLALCFLTSAILVCCWLYRAAANARALGAEMSIKPGWAVGGFFIPFLNLVMPYQATKEIWLHAAQDRKPSAIPVNTWWITWLIGSIGERIIYKTESHLESVHLTLPIYLNLASLLCMLISAYCLTKIVRGIQNQQALLAAGKKVG
ncbi:DUF4328 domain-containing protein [Neisseria wadsworthii]|uniref:DUF4328 domain-containing protein n=1 Tax=Neisseria wadsworthii TaxID=607711 RepID=UPI00131E9B2D|nr:DUF4328 domain-containing protein [Neisseria wadsworthii]